MCFRKPFKHPAVRFYKAEIGCYQGKAVVGIFNKGVEDMGGFLKVFEFLFDI